MVPIYVLDMYYIGAFKGWLVNFEIYFFKVEGAPPKKEERLKTWPLVKNPQF